MLAGLAEAELGRGEIAAARRAAESAVAVSPKWRHFQTEPHLAFARVLLRADGAQAAVEVTRQLDTAATLADTAGAGMLAPHVREVRAKLAEIMGDDATRRSELREAHRLWVHLGADGPAARVAALLASAGDDPSAADAPARNRL